MASIYGGRYGWSPDENTADYIRRYPVIGQRMDAIARFASADRVSAEALFNLSQEIQGDLADASRRVADYESKLGTRMQQPMKVIDAERDRLAKLKADGEDVRQRHNATKRRSNTSQGTLDSGATQVARLAASGSAPRIVSTPLPRGDKLEKLAEARESIATTLAALKKVRRASMPEEEAVSLGIRKIDEMIAAHSIKFDFTDARGPQPYLGFAGLEDAEGGRTPPNILGAVLSLGRDQAVEQLKAAAAHHYSTRVDLALDRQTKADRITTLEAELLALERIDVELVLALRADGRDVEFRPNTDARAILGVEGVTGLKPNSTLMEVADF